MKLIACLTFLSLLVTLNSSFTADGDTVIYVVRHAEKDTSDPKNNNPDLSPDGRRRAKALDRFLKHVKITAVFSTSYKRTMQTVEPVALRNGIIAKSYDSKKPEELAKLINSEFADKKILVAGHSNTILEQVKAFGVNPPVDKLNDNDYDLIFIVSIHANGDRTLKIKRYGRRHHSTEIQSGKSAF